MEPILSFRNHWVFLTRPYVLPLLLATVVWASARGAPADPLAHTFLPFDDNFEAFTNGTPLDTGTNGWMGSSGSRIVAANTHLAPDGSMNIAIIPIDSALATRFTGMRHTNIWIQMDLRPGLYDDTYPPAVDTNATSIFYVDSNGHFVVHNGLASPNTARSTNWVTLTNFSVGTNGANWVTIGLDVDFNSRLCHLYASNTLVAENIKFVNQGLSNFSGFKIYNGAITTTYVDNVSVAPSKRSVLTVTGSFTVSTKVYDGNTTAAISQNNLALRGIHEGDDVKLAAAAVFSDKHAGKGKLVSLSPSRLAGPDALNYTLSLADAPTSTGEITQANAITVTAVNNVKVYDGTTSATGMPAITEGHLAGDDTATWSEAYADKNAGEGKTLIPSGTIHDGHGGKNYRGITFAANRTGVITRKPLAAALGPTISKVYDGNTTAILDATHFSLSGFVGDEMCALTQTTTTGVYASADAGTGILVTATLTPGNFSGSDGGFSPANYELPVSAEGSVGDITKAPATVKLHDLAQKYKDAVFINGGTTRAVTNTTVPAGLKVIITYNGSIWEPVNPGTYAVTGTVYDANYQGSATGTLTISK